MAEATSRRKQEISHLKLFKTKVEQIDPLVGRQTLAIVVEKVDEVNECERDEYGLVLDPDDPNLQRPPEIGSVHGINPSVLQFRVESAAAGVVRNAGQPNQADVRTRDGNIPMTQGALTNATGTPEGTSDEMLVLLREHEARKKRTLDEDAATAAATKRRRLDKEASLPQRLRNAEGLMVEKSSQVGVCKDYLKLLKEEADYAGNQARKTELIRIGKLPSRDQVTIANDLFRARQSQTPVASVAIAVDTAVCVGDNMPDVAAP